MARYGGWLGAVFGFVAVALGAFGAHALKAQLSVEALEWYRTGVQYQFWHALGMLALVRACGAAPVTPGRRAAIIACACFAAGIVLFSGSLYAMALSDPRGRWLGAVTPVGGLCFLAGWICAAVALWPSDTR